MTATQIRASTQIVAGSITSTEMGTDSVTNAKIDNLAVDTAELAALAVTAAKIANTTITATQMNLTGTFDFSSGTMTVADPSASADVANKNYVDTVAQGLAAKAAVKATTTAALPAVTPAGTGVGKTLTANANAVLALDGINTWVDVNNDGGSTDPNDPSPASRVLIQDQVLADDNGIYCVTQKGDASNPFILTRSLDYDGTPGNEVNGGDFVFVTEGTIFADTGHVMTNDDPITVDTTDLTWSQFSGAGTYTAGDGLDLGGVVFSVDVTDILGSGLTESSNNIDIDWSTTFSEASKAIAAAKLASTSNAEGASIIGIEDSGTLITATDVEGALAENRTAIDAIENNTIASTDGSLSTSGDIGSDNQVLQVVFSTSGTANRAIDAQDLGSNSNALGAFLIGIEDSGTLITATNVEAALAELAGNIGSINTLAATKIYIGDVSGDAQEFALSGDVTMTSGGVVTIGASKIDENELNNVDGGVDGLSFVLTSGYSAGAGTVAGGDTLQVAIQKLDAGIGTIDALADGKIYLGDVSNIAQEITLSGDVTMSNAGVTTIGAAKIEEAMFDAAVDGETFALSGGYAASPGTVTIADTLEVAIEKLAGNQDALTTLADGTIYMGDVSNIAQEVTMSGDVTITNAGVTTIGAAKVEEAMFDAAVDADTFDLSAGYAAATGTVAIADSIEVAIEKLDGNIAGLTSKINVREVPTGNIDGSNTVYTLAQENKDAKESVYLNGVLQNVGAGNDYTVSTTSETNDTLTFNTAPQTADVILVTSYEPF